MSTTLSAAALVAVAATAAVPVSVQVVSPAHSDTQPGSGTRHDEAAHGLTAQTTVTTAYVARASAFQVYLVRPGDTLSRISRAHCGTGADYPSLAAASGIKNPDLIFPGDRVTLNCHAHAPRVPHATLPVSTASKVSLTGGADEDRLPVSHAAPRPPKAVHHPSPGGLHGTLGCSGLEALWESVGGPAWAARMAGSVAMYESNGHQYAHNPSGASGYWQILGSVVPGDIYNPVVNAENALSKFRASGDTWAQWTTAGEAASHPVC